MYKKKGHRYTAILLVVSMILALLPVSPLQVHAAMTRADDLKVQFGRGTTIGNLSYDADNAFINFLSSGTPGFTYSGDSEGKIDWDKGDVYGGRDGDWSTDTFTLDVSKNSTLRTLAESGHADLKIGFDYLAHYEGSFLGITTWTRVSNIEIIHTHGSSKETVIAGRNLGAEHETIRITPQSVIKIVVTGEGDDKDGPTGVRGLYLKFQDKQRPVMNGYTFTGNGNERYNKKIGQTELYVKQQENITLAYNFSEPVRPTALSSAYYEHFLRHPLFTNPDGTGLPAAGQQMYLTNLTYNKDNLGTVQKDIVFQYTGSRYQNSGNNPLEPKITGELQGVSPMDQSLEQKFYGAVLADGAGNVAVTDFTGKASLNSNTYLQGKTVNPFDYKNEGYRVIVDGVAPKYTKSGNGITPEILTGVTLNKNDTIDFTVKFTEEAMVREGYNVNNTFLYLNNGMKAKYIGGENTDTWTFRMDIKGELVEEATLLKVIALTNEDKKDDSDKDVISDYAGNLLIQPANLLGEHTDGDTSLVNSTIDWAKLGIDNTPPKISYRFEADGATATLYKKNGKVTIDADDPTIKIPYLDPVASGEPRPSQGIYRPSNMTGSASPSVGLVYYSWSQDPNDPLLGKEADNWAAIKRFSLTAKQPSEELYSEGFEGVQLQVANNKTNMIAPPAEALTSEGSGPWYLHTWTADMTWDTARQLMQYEKKQQFVEDHKEQYEQWKAEATGSETDKIVAADNKALAAVGQYGDTSVWPLSDFKQEDSNWTYKVTPFLLDNKGPDITFSVYSGDGTMNVQLTTDVSDPHSGMKSVYYQWVAAGASPADINWKQTVLTDGKFNAETLNEVVEDGQYQLYVKAIDNAGNESVKGTSSVAVVNSASSVNGSFDTDANPNYVKSHDVNFSLSGIVPDKVAYAFSDSSVRPASENEFTQLFEIPAVQAAPLVADTGTTSESDGSAQAEGTGDGSEQQAGDAQSGDSSGAGDSTNIAPLSAPTDNHHYVIPAQLDKEGMHYIHVMAKAGDRYFYYSKAYYFDNQPPVVTYSKTGVAYPLESHDVTVTVSELYSKDGLTKEYKWVKEGESIPDLASDGWNQLPASGKVTIDNTALASGAVADYKLYVKAVDGAGNAIVSSTDGIFKVSRAGEDNTPPAEATGELIYLYGDDPEFGEVASYTAVLKLSLNTEDKRGYEYSLSPDGGTSWQKWRPYTNFVSVQVPTKSPSDLQIQVKYRTAAGVIGSAKPIEVTSVPNTEPVYALASLSTTRPVSSTQGVEIQVAPPLGIKVNASAANPQAPVRKGNTFTVRMNGFYSFDLTDLNDPTRTETLYVVVSNIDDTLPIGTIEYLTTEKTGGNVAVQLASTSEPVVILNNSGRSTFVFSDNGTFTFQFRDEAGNVGTATATVANIDKEAPKVKIVQSFAYGENNAETFGTITDENGNVILASGVKLEVVKADPSAKAFRVLGNSSSVIMRKNGVVKFTVADEYGNTSVVEANVDYVAGDTIDPESVTYTFVDENGNALPADRIVSIGGQSFAKGSVKVTIKGKVASPNKVFNGVKPISDENGKFTNQLSDAEGNYTYSRIYTANGSTLVGISDLVGNVNKIPVTVKGLDNKAPELTLRQAAVAVQQNKASFNFAKDLGGYTASDNVSSADRIAVKINGLDLTKLGRQRVTYTATDEVGNVAQVSQDVVVVSNSGMSIFANDTLISGDSGETALFNTNQLTFNITRFNVMNVGGEELVNEKGTFDLYYYSGLYREGQMKLIANKLSYQQLVNGQYTVTFPQSGWYTIVVRNQERERVYATFFISKKAN